MKKLPLYRFVRNMFVLFASASWNGQDEKEMSKLEHQKLFHAHIRKVLSKEKQKAFFGFPLSVASFYFFVLNDFGKGLREAALMSMTDFNAGAFIGVPVMLLFFVTMFALFGYTLVATVCVLKKMRLVA